ncbi:TIGR01777 family protein [Endozoicomonas sp. (ex Bugula neritina AB1)]|nr:TIGR01777 family protein [Endozoicomonas sp. (ex Bugula neritina AB1)]
MQFLITGGTGFIGQRLVRRLLSDGHQVTVVSRRHAKEVRQLLSSDVKPVRSVTAVNPSVFYDAVINLAGEGIMNERWSAARKRTLLDSRIGITQELVDLIERMDQKPGRFISGSAVGFYGAHEAEDRLDETSQAGNDFAASLCVRWERAAGRVASQGVPVSIFRTGIVLHPNGGALQKMLPPFRLGLGGPIGNGQQMMSWIHMEDMVELLMFLIQSNDAEGIYNATAPVPVSNKTFSRALGRVLRRPAFLPMPVAALKLLLGESSILVTKGQNVVPAHLLDDGFEFRFSDIEKALKNLLV